MTTDTLQNPSVYIGNIIDLMQIMQNMGIKYLAIRIFRNIEILKNDDIAIIEEKIWLTRIRSKSPLYITSL